MSRTGRWVALLVLLAGLVVAGFAARRPLARAAFDRGLRARSEWRLRDALGDFRIALFLDSSFDAARVEGGEVHALRGEFAAAIPMLRAASAAEDVLGGRRDVALGTALFQSAESDAALAAHGRARDAARRAGDRRLEAEALIGISRVLYHLNGRSDEARVHLEQALALGRALGDPRVEADALRHLGVLLWWFEGDRRRAIPDYCEPALARYRAANDLHGEGVVLTNIGLMHGVMLDLPRSMHFHEAARRIKERIGDRAGIADSLAAIGDLYVVSRNYRKARRSFEEALTIARENGYRLLQDEVESKLAWIYVEIGALDDAVPLFERIVVREKASPLMAKYRMQYLADVQLRRGNAGEALRWLERAQLVESTIGQPDVISSLGALLLRTDAHRVRGDLAEAESAQQQSDAIARDAGEVRWPLAVSPSIVRAELLHAQGRHDDAIRWLRASADSDAAALASAGTPVAPERTHTYERLFRFLLGTGGDGALAMRFLEQWRYRSLLELISQMDGGGAVAARARPLPPEAIARALDGRTAIVQYVITRPEAFAIIVTRDGTRSLRLPATSDAIATKTRLLRELLFVRATDPERWRPVATDLHRILIGSIEAAGVLDGIQRLRIVPWGVLRDLPFAALTRSSGRYLVEDYVLSIRPSASGGVLRGEKHGQQNAFCFARRGFAVDGLPDLPEAEVEARAIASSTGAALRLDDEANEQELARVAPRAGAIHFATHAVIETDMPLLSRLVLAHTESSDGQLTIQDVLRLRFPGSLVTLGACRSGISRPWSGSDEDDFGRIGLVEAMLHAGARNVVATLAPVSDRAASALMRRFYAGGVPRDPPARLADVQRSMRGTHPRHWAAFFVAGS